MEWMDGVHFKFYKDGFLISYLLPWEQVNFQVILNYKDEGYFGSHFENVQLLRSSGKQGVLKVLKVLNGKRVHHCSTGQ